MMHGRHPLPRTLLGIPCDPERGAEDPGIGVQCLLCPFTERGWQAGDEDAAFQTGARIFLPGEQQNRVGQTRRERGFCMHWEPLG